MYIYPPICLWFCVDFFFFVNIPTQEYIFLWKCRFSKDVCECVTKTYSATRWGVIWMDRQAGKQAAIVSTSQHCDNKAKNIKLTNMPPTQAKTFSVLCFFWGFFCICHENLCSGKYHYLPSSSSSFLMFSIMDKENFFWKPIIMCTIFLSISKKMGFLFIKIIFYEFMTLYKKKKLETITFWIELFSFCHTQNAKWKRKHKSVSCHICLLNHQATYIHLTIALLVV